MRTSTNSAAQIQLVYDRDRDLDELLGNRGPLDTPLLVTFFPDRFAGTAHRETLSLRQMADKVRTTRAAKKGALPYWKLATFGDVRSDANCLRTNENVLRVTGIEGDYDAGAMSPDEAVKMLRAAGIAGMIYTTASHRPDAPRWRVFCPLSAPAVPDLRRGLVERLDNAMGGVLARESLTLSQSYYYGGVEGQDTPEVFLVEGQPVDKVLALPTVQCGDTKVPAAAMQPADDVRREYPLDLIRSALEMIRDIHERSVWRAAGAALEYQFDGDTLAYDLWNALSLETPWKYDRKEQWKTWTGFTRARDRGWATIDTLFEMANARGWCWGITDDDFDDLPEDDLLPADARAEKVGLIRAKNGDLKPTLHNAVLMLRKVNRDLGYRIRLNDMTGREGWRGGPIGDGELGAFRVAMEQAGMHNAGADLTAHAVKMIAQCDRFHPVKDWLKGLGHDGTPRLDTWLTRYLGVEDTPYVRAVGRAFLIAMVARVMRPGCKHDHVLVLKSGQGARKSTACRILSGDEYFSDTMPAIRNDKIEAWRHLRGKWLVELAELAPSRNADQEDLKSFLSGQVDSYRMPYARLEESVHRQCVFVGTTNEDTFLRDATGGRRFWPVTCGAIDTEALARDREQLFAEAVAAYRTGEAWHLSPEMEQLAAVEQQAAREEDPWEGPIMEFLDGATEDPIEPKARDSVMVKDVLRHLGVPCERQRGDNAKRIARILRMLGWEGVKREGQRVWVRP